jgi:hypothetical protein
MATPDSTELHKRARESASELRKLTTTLSAAGVGAFFIAITGERNECLTDIQRTFAIITVTLLGIGVLSGMFAWQADAERWYFGAKESEAIDESTRDKYRAKRHHWKHLTWRLAQTMRWSFLIGVGFAVLYSIARLCKW